MGRYRLHRLSLAHHNLALDTLVRFSAGIPASLSCLKKATLELPLSVLNTGSGSAALILVMAVLYSVCLRGAGFSPRASGPAAFS